MTYAEVTISFLVVSMFIMPICTTLVGAMGSLQETRSIQQSTLYTETLLENVKLQLDSDIYAAKEIANNQLNGTPAYYLNDFVASSVKKTPKSFTEVFSSPIEDKGSFFNKLYNTDKYAYEVAIWDLQELFNDDALLDLATNEWQVDFTQIDKAIKWYSNPDYQADTFGDISNLPSFSVSNKVATIFKGDPFLTNYTVNSDNASNITGISTIKLKTESNTIKIDSIVNSGTMFTSTEHDLIQGKSNEIVGKGYTITNNHTDNDSQGLVIIDARNIDFATATVDTELLRIHNNGTTPILVKVLTNATNMAMVDNVLQLMCVDDTSGNRINIEYVNDLVNTDSYLIGIVVRDMAPSLGNKGKIVKTMFDVYSYVPNE